MRQHTLTHSTTLTGIGIHSGKKNTIRFFPEPENTGIRFKFNTPNTPIIPATTQSIQSSNRATILGQNGHQVYTPEHLLAACWGLSLTNLTIELTAPEIPIMDGSAAPFVAAFQDAGLTPQSPPIPTYPIETPTVIRHNSSNITVVPCETSTTTMIIHYPDSFIGAQSITFEWDSEQFVEEIAPARTYGFEHEVDALLKNDLAQGGSLENAVVIGETEYLTPLRFSDELVRHKLLDMIGDLSLTGHIIQGHIIGFCSGHHLNLELAKTLGHNLQTRTTESAGLHA